jgi:hypothetical protein
LSVELNLLFYKSLRKITSSPKAGTTSNLSVQHSTGIRSH